MGKCCPSCGLQNREGAKFCTKCGEQLGASEGPQDIEMGPYRSVYQEYHDLGQRDETTPPVPSLEIGPLPIAAPLQPTGESSIPGPERSIIWSLLLSLLTCGIFGLVWLYQIGNDLRNLTGSDEPRAGLNVFLTILSCNIWGVYLAYRYPKLIDESQSKLHLQESNLSLVCLILSLFGVWGTYGLGLIGLALMQNELNKIWRRMKGIDP